MSKKVFKERKFNLGIVESYKKSVEQESPILGSFSVKKMTVENMISQNRTKYAPEVWAQPTAFGKGGKFLDENGKLKPSTLFGSVDHPLDNRAELLLQEAAIAWYDINRNADGSWDGSAHILNNPQGRIVKTFLDYAKQFGGGDLLGVSSRALGESTLSESNGEQVEAIVPDSFELMSFDFVYNPSFQTAVAHLNESKGAKKNILAESVRKLAKDDEDHADVYKNFADKIEKIDKEFVNNMKNKETKFEGNSLSKAKLNYLKELRDQEKKLHDALYELKNMTDEEFAEQKKGDRGKLMKVIKKEYDEVLAEVEALEAAAEQPEVVEESKVEKEVEKEVITEAEDLENEELEQMAEELEEELEEEPAEDDVAEDEEEIELTDEEIEEDSAEPTLAEVKEELDTLKTMLQDLRDFLMPVEDSEIELEDEEVTEEDEEVTEEDEESDEEQTEDEEAVELSEEDLEELSDEELEYLASLDL